MADRSDYKRRWRKANPDKQKEYRRRYDEKHPGRSRKQRVAATKAWRKRNPKKFREAHRKYQLNWRLQKKFGITIQQRDAMLAAQGGKCKGCGSDTPNWKGDWHVDHCHKTNKVRGILCHNCNTALGRVKDSPDVLRNLARYLESNEGQAKVKLKQKVSRYG